MSIRWAGRSTSFRGGSQLTCMEGRGGGPAGFHAACCPVYKTGTARAARHAATLPALGAVAPRLNAPGLPDAAAVLCRPCPAQLRPSRVSPSGAEP